MNEEVKQRVQDDEWTPPSSSGAWLPISLLAALLTFGVAAAALLDV